MITLSEDSRERQAVSDRPLYEAPPPNRVPDAQRDDSAEPRHFAVMEGGSYAPVATPDGEMSPVVWYEGRFRLVGIAEPRFAPGEFHDLRRDGPNFPCRPRSRRPITKALARKTRRFVSLRRDPHFLEWLDRVANPPGLIPTVEWFARHPNAEFRLVGSADNTPEWSTFTFYAREPRWAPGYEFLGTSLRKLLAQPEFNAGTPRERLTRVFRWLQSGGVFRDPFRRGARR